MYLCLSHICRSMARNQGYRLVAVSLGDFSNNGPHRPNNPLPQSHCSQIRYTIYLRCGFLAIWTGCRPSTHGHRAMAEALRKNLSLSGRCQNLSFIDDVSIHTGRTAVSYWLMSKQTSVDYRPISISQ